MTSDTYTHRTPPLQPSAASFSWQRVYTRELERLADSYPTVPLQTRQRWAEYKADDALAAYSSVAG